VKELPDPLAAHLRAPRCVGDAEPEAGRGEGRNDACGDRLVVTVARSANGLELRFRAQACSGVIAVASLVLAELDGRGAGEARAFDVGAAVERAGGLPPHRRHAVRVVRRALDAALDAAGL
jgi:NifU-like protein involved in Fe-S cluster formation